MEYALENNVDPNQGTIEFWVKPNWYGNDGEIHWLIDISEDSWRNGISILKYSSGSLFFMIYDGSGGMYLAYAGVSQWMPGEWHHIAAVWDLDAGDGSNDMALYIDGVLMMAQAENTSAITNFVLSGGIHVGCRAIGNDYRAYAVIDQLRISGVMRQ